mmetsp:Transcript_23465/g.28682  ORF Transcript_23465/g.28682 Transcript_23465/m.28682 type:complete len:207 (-) Transcript_23465:172-792(-)
MSHISNVMSNIKIPITSNSINGNELAPALGYKDTKQCERNPSITKNTINDTRNDSDLITELVDSQAPNISPDHVIQNEIRNDKDAVWCDENDNPNSTSHDVTLKTTVNIIFDNAKPSQTETGNCVNITTNLHFSETPPNSNEKSILHNDNPGVLLSKVRKNAMARIASSKGFNPNNISQKHCVCIRYDIRESIILLTRCAIAPWEM